MAFHTLPHHRVPHRSTADAVAMVGFRSMFRKKSEVFHWALDLAIHLRDYPDIYVRSRRSQYCVFPSACTARLWGALFHRDTPVCCRAVVHRWQLCCLVEFESHHGVTSGIVVSAMSNSCSCYSEHMASSWPTVRSLVDRVWFTVLAAIARSSPSLTYLCDWCLRMPPGPTACRALGGVVRRGSCT
jgi:hypothetical protein